MSDNPTLTGGTAAPAENGAPPTPPAAPPAQAAQAQPAAEQATQPFRAFANQKELDEFVKGSKSQAGRAALKKLATDLGFEDADEMREALQTLRQAQGGAQPLTPTEPFDSAQGKPGAQAPTTQVDQASRLQMALTVGAKLNLPAALIGRLQGSTPDEMEADAQTLLALMGSTTRQPPGPGIPPPPGGNPPVTFTRAQLQDAKFVREHAAEIQAAAREGRIVRS